MTYSQAIRDELLQVKPVCKNCEKATTKCASELVKRCCKIAYLRNAYLTFGTIINPIKEYHLEFHLPSKELSDDILSVLESVGLQFKTAARGKAFILYIKGSQQIEDTLTCFGAVKASMELMNIKIEKELRNNVNRKTNCETANIDKTINAAFYQIQQIEHIIRVKGLDYLPIDLKQIAVLRLENPDASLSELCQIFGENHIKTICINGKDITDGNNKVAAISRSGINHRLKKICLIADEL